MHSRNNKNSLRRVQVVEGALALDCSKRVSLSVSLEACLSKRVSHTGYGGRVGLGLRRRARWLDPVPAPGTLLSFLFCFLAGVWGTDLGTDVCLIYTSSQIQR